MKFYRHTLYHITIHCISLKCHFPRLDIYGKPLYGNSHYISTENTYQRKLETKFIQKENLVLISQSNKLYI